MGSQPVPLRVSARPDAPVRFSGPDSVRFSQNPQRRPAANSDQPARPKRESFIRRVLSGIKRFITRVFRALNPFNWFKKTSASPTEGGTETTRQPGGPSPIAPVRSKPLMVTPDLVARLNNYFGYRETEDGPEISEERFLERYHFYYGLSPGSQTGLLLLPMPREEFLALPEAEQMEIQAAALQNMEQLANHAAEFARMQVCGMLYALNYLSPDVEKTSERQAIFEQFAGDPESSVYVADLKRLMESPNPDALFQNEDLKFTFHPISYYYYMCLATPPDSPEHQFFAGLIDLLQNTQVQVN